MMQTPPAQPEPDTKDWTFTITAPCPECGYDPTAFADADIAAELRATAPRWSAALARADAATRPAPVVWSPLEYACHVRDLHGVFAGRVAQMRARNHPHFASWNGDRAAIDDRYYAQDPTEVAAELTEATERAAAAYEAVPGDAWQRDGIRGGGATFTISTLGHYHLHDVLHHLHDVRG